MVGDFGIGSWGAPVHDPREPKLPPLPTKLTADEYFALFGRTGEEMRWQSSADSQEYLGIVTYLVQRSCKH